ncbi:MAG: tetratricopeptide repeat protein [Spirochaetia bacterium]|jgi:tetratricopeptide (TPR) repeat protein
MPLETLRGKEVALTGRLASMKRSEAVRRIGEAGGRHVEEPAASTSLIVAGHAGHLTASGGVTRNMLLFRELKQNGAPIRLIEETEFLKLLGAADELSDFSRLYTAAQVSRIIETPLSVVRSWLRKGLIRPARVANRLAWFEIKDILQARNLSRLTASGVPASQIRSSLEQIARWLPGGGQIVGRLDSFARRLRVRLPGGGWADPSGQLLFSFGPDAVAPGVRVSSFPLDPQAAGDPLSDAEDAEDRGDLAAAAEGYARALDGQPDAEAFFNFGNILYQLAREGEAAEQYLQALELDPEFAETWNNLGNALVAMGKADDAVMAYRRALSLEPDYPDAHCNLATILERLDRHDEAAVHRTECVRAFPSEARLRLLRAPAADDVES